MTGNQPVGGWLSPNLSWREFIATQHRAADILVAQEHPSELIRINAKRHATDLWQPWRDLVGPIRVTSGYRCARLNMLVGGTPNSAHMEGRATDNVPVYMTIRQAMDRLLESAIEYDKVIVEFGRWIHLQSPRKGREPRRLALMTIDGARFPEYNPDKFEVV